MFTTLFTFELQTTTTYVSSKGVRCEAIVSSGVPQITSNQAPFLPYPVRTWLCEGNPQPPSYTAMFSQTKVQCLQIRTPVSWDMQMIAQFVL